MARRKALKKYCGVYVTESEVRVWRGRPDRLYEVIFEDPVSKKQHYERCGWASEGWGPETAQQKRHDLVNAQRTGEYKSKRQRKVETVLYTDLMTKHYLPWCKDNLAQHRLEKSKYETWLKDTLGPKRLVDVSPLDVERVRSNMKKRNKADSTIYSTMATIRQSFNRARSWKMFDGPNPCDQVGFPRPNNARQRFLSHSEAEVLIEALYERSEQVAQIATISLYTGLRLGEVFGLTWGCVDLTQGTLLVRDSKNGESRHAFLTEPVKSVLSDLTPGETPSELLFTTKYGEPVAWLSKVFAEVVKELGLNNGVVDSRQKVSFHSLRHTWASWAAVSGVPLYTIGKCLGHKTSTMTARYAHLSQESHKHAFEAVARGAREALEVEQDKEKAVDVSEEAEAQ
jgi:integrase